MILLPAVFSLLYVHAFGVSVVFSDAWSMVPLFDKLSSGTLQLSDLFNQHNEHRMFFPECVELLLGSITRYDNVTEMYLIQVCYLATTGVLLLAFRGALRGYGVGPSWLLLFVPVSFLIFSFRQYENILFGYQIDFALAQLFSVLALFMLYALGHGRFRKLAFAAALGSATIAAFSVLQGLFTWPVGLLQLLIGPLERRQKRIFAVLWGLTGLVEWVVYFIDYKKPRSSPSLLYVPEHPIEGILFFLRMLGSSLFWGQDSAFVGGLLLVGLALASLFLIYRGGRLGEYSFWVALLFYSLLTLATITLGRSGLGAEQALIPRYTAFSVLAVASVYAILVKTTLERRSSAGRLPRANIVLLVALSGALLSGLAISYPNGIRTGGAQKISREEAAFILSTYESQPDAAFAQSLNPHADIVREHAPVLQNLGYNVFSEGPQATGLPPPLSALSLVASPTSSAIEALNTDARGGAEVDQQNRSVVIPKGASFVALAGWTVDADNKSAAGGVYIDVDDKLFPAFYGTDRQNVAESFGIPAYRYSGFERYIPVSEIGTGPHEVSLVVLTADKEGYYQPDRKVSLEVR